MKSKYLIGLFVYFIFLSGCKKDIQTKLIGKWAEQSPCVAGVGSCYVFEIKDNGTYNMSSPNNIPGSYLLINNNTKIQFTGGFGNGTYDFQLMNENLLTIKRFYTGYYFDTPLFHKDITLIKYL